MNATLTKLFKFKKIIAVIIAVIIYFVLTYASNEQQIAFEKDLQKLDVNKDGIYSDEEVSEKQKEIIEKMQNDTGGQIAPYTLIPFAAFCGLFIYFTIRVIENYVIKNNEPKLYN